MCGSPWNSRDYWRIILHNFVFKKNGYCSYLMKFRETELLIISVYFTSFFKIHTVDFFLYLHDFFSWNCVSYFFYDYIPVRPLPLFFTFQKKKKYLLSFFKLRFDEFFYKYLSLMHDINPYTLKIDNFWCPVFIDSFHNHRCVIFFCGDQRKQ